MMLFIETVIILIVLIYFYRLIFKNVFNPLKISKPLAVGILIVGFLVLPITMKILMIIILAIAYIVNKNKIMKYDPTTTI